MHSLVVWGPLLRPAVTCFYERPSMSALRRAVGSIIYSVNLSGEFLDIKGGFQEFALGRGKLGTKFNIVATLLISLNLKCHDHSIKDHMSMRS